MSHPNLIAREILLSICKKSFLYIRYTHPNTERKDTFFWIGIDGINIETESISCYGYNLDTKQARDFNFPLSIQNITEAKVVDETYYETRKSHALLEDIKHDPEKYEKLFGANGSSLNILDYYSECVQLNNTPYVSDDVFHLIDKLDATSFINGEYQLTEPQFDEVVEKLAKKLKDKRETKRRKTIYLCLNVLTIRNARRGNFVVAYRKLALNIKNKSLKPNSEITVCREFIAQHNSQEKTKYGIDTHSILRYIDTGDLYLLENFERNQEEIKDILTQNLPYFCKVDDNPYIFPLQRDMLFSLTAEFDEIKRMYCEHCLTEPLKAFFGRLVKINTATQDVPIVLLDNNANLKQLLAIHAAMEHSVSYVQGPPGTGKTSTIVNTILTAFFNGKTVLVTSYNNKPIDGVTEKLKQITYRDNQPLFPFLLIKNNNETPQALAYIKQMYETAKTKTVFADVLALKKNNEIKKTKQISLLLQEYAKEVELDETESALRKMLDKIVTMDFQFYLQDIPTRQLQEKRKNIREIDCEKTVALINENKVNFFMYIYFRSVELLQQIDLPDYDDFRAILFMDDEDEQVKAFNRYLNKEENILKLLKVFPVILTTCISAKKIAQPHQYFDMTIMDEASQCDNATALIPIIRAQQLMLVGDPNQLNPVIVVNKEDDAKLKAEYQIPDSYDFVDNSTYKTFIANDFISSEILLSHHYRCSPKIIQFNNRKYYNDQLVIQTSKSNGEPLVFIPIADNTTSDRNKAPKEITAIMDYIQDNKEKNIGIITPFRNQQIGIMQALQESGIDTAAESSQISCGTVHSFQGEEKDCIIFSLALTDKTSNGTYNWLKCNKELINVATSRPKNKLVLVASPQELERLHHAQQGDDDIYELYQYVKSNGTYKDITMCEPETKACGLKPYSTETENEFLQTLNNALSNLDLNKRFFVGHEVPLSSIFEKDLDNIQSYFLESKFDFVVFEQKTKKAPQMPCFAFEIDGVEHGIDSLVIERDKKKQMICDSHHFTLIRVPNSYARRYVYIKTILENFFIEKNRVP